MAKFGVSCDGNLTIVFSDKEDLLKAGLELCGTMFYLAEKYDKAKPDKSIIATLRISRLNQEDADADNELDGPEEPERKCDCIGCASLKPSGQICGECGCDQSYHWVGMMPGDFAECHACEGKHQFQEKSDG